MFVPTATEKMELLFKSPLYVPWSIFQGVDCPIGQNNLHILVVLRLVVFRFLISLWRNFMAASADSNGP